MRLPIHSRKPGAVHRATRYRWTLAEYSRTIFMVQPLGLRFPSPGSESKIIPDDPADGDAWLYQPNHSVCAECRSEEHTSELQSLRHLVCRLLLEKNKSIRYVLTFSNLCWWRLVHILQIRRA